MDYKTVIAETEKYYLPVFARYQLVLDHGNGCKLYDSEGNEYLDFFAGIAVNCLGYAHPAVTGAVLGQAAKVMHCSNLYYTAIQAKAVKVISEVSGFDRIFLANSGAEANEGALKLARKYGKKVEGKYRIITAVQSFHGRTLLTLTATGQPHYHEGYEPLPAGFDYVAFGDIKELEAKMGDDVCAVMLEPIQGEGGVHVPSDEYLRQVRALCDKHDALLIFDEVQSGVGRSGKWFAYMHSGVKPDVLTFAKGIGSGFPMGGFAVDERLAHVFKPGDHGSTFGGNPLACAAAYAALTAIRAENLVDKAADRGTYMMKGLKKLQEKYPEKIKEVRGRGLLLGMELVKEGRSLVEACMKDHLLINCTVGNVIRLAPPLIVTEKEIDEALAVMDKALAVF